MQLLPTTDRAILLFAQSREMDPSLIELFVDGKEDGLPDAERLDKLGLGDGSVVFMLQRQGWCWTVCGGDIALSGEGLVVTKQVADEEASFREDEEEWQLATGGTPMTEGSHYWEVKITRLSCEDCPIMIGAVRPGLEYDGRDQRYMRCLGLDDEEYDPNQDCNAGSVFYINGHCGGLYGHGQKLVNHHPPRLKQGDCIGVLLDLDAGWMQFYHNGARWGPGFTEGVTGPLLRAVELCNLGDQLTALPGAVAPAPEMAGAAAGEPCEVVGSEEGSTKE
jgi:hypothetical protein